MKEGSPDQAPPFSNLHEVGPDLPAFMQQTTGTTDRVQTIIDDLVHAVINDLQVITTQLDLLGLAQTDTSTWELIFHRLQHVSHLLRQGRAVLVSSPLELSFR